MIDIRKPPQLAQALIQSYLVEIQNLQRLRKQTPHVVRIDDFDFDSRSGEGNRRHFQVMTIKVSTVLYFSLFGHGTSGW